MLKVRIALVVIVVTMLLIVAAQNSGVVDLRFLAWQTSISLVALIFLTAGAGFVAGFMLGKVGNRMVRK